MTIVILPLETHIPTVAGFSSLFLMFAVLAGYVVLNRREMFDRLWMHPVFLAAYVFIGITFLLEFASPQPLYEPIFRFLLMAVGAMLVASLCRDRPALGACLYGYIGAALWLALVLFLSSYGTLQGAATTNFNDASKVRSQAFSNKPVKGNINAMSFTCLQGGVVSFAFALVSGTLRRRRVFFGIALLCFSASFLTMSRAAIAISILSCIAILYAHGVRHMKVLVLAGLLVASIFLLVPGAIWSRMSLQAGEGDSTEETRVALYRIALQSLPEYLISGVGAGNFANKWGFENGFGAGDHVFSLHNTFLQLMVYWGLTGLLPFIAMIWQAYRCFPQRCATDVLALCLLGIAVSLFAMMFFNNEFYSKGLSLGLGMLVASRCWIWRTGMVEPAKSGAERC